MIEFPELSDETIKIKEIQREAGYRTKVAVYTEKDEIDPVGACVGSKGNRIQNITKELLHYCNTSLKLITNSCHTNI